MRDEDIDRVLLNEPEMIPSASFVDSLMASVRREAVAPPLIPFPWRWALPGLCATSVTILFIQPSILTLAQLGSILVSDGTPRICDRIHCCRTHTPEQAKWTDGDGNHLIRQGEKSSAFDGNNDETFNSFDSTTWSATTAKLDAVMMAWEKAVADADDTKLKAPQLPGLLTSVRTTPIISDRFSTSESYRDPGIRTTV